MRYRLPIALASVLAFVFHTAAGASLEEQLFTAAWDGHAEAIAALHAAGVNPNARSNDGFTPLHIAAQQGHPEAIAALHAAGADPDAQNYDGFTPLHSAASSGHIEAISALHAAGANPNTRSNDGQTPLRIATQQDHAEAIVALYAAGADPNVQDNDGLAPLHAAAWEGHTEAIAALLAAGADPKAQGNIGFTPLHSAASYGHTEATVALLAAGADPNARDNDGLTPLHDAALEGHTEAIVALHTAGAALNAQNNDGDTPLDLAAQRGHAKAAASLHAIPVPKDAIGIWSKAECGGSGDMYLVNSSHALIVRSSEGESALAVVPAEWAGGAVVLTPADGVVVLPTNNLSQCTALPALFYVGFGEVIALFQAYDGIRALCENDTPLSCAAAVFATVDISDDERISEAELARVVRASGTLLTYATLADEQRKSLSNDGRPSSFVPAGKLYGAVAITVFGGPFVIGNLVRSYDYDGDGFLSLEEIMQDRLPDDMAEIAVGLASAGIAEAGTTMVRNVPNLIGTLETLLRRAF